MGLCWLTTTEWAVAYSDQNRQNVNLTILTIKKQQPPAWNFLENLVANNYSSIKFPALVSFSYIQEWQIVSSNFIILKQLSKFLILGYCLL